MKYLIHLSLPIRNGINGDNLRGEPRCERNILSALLASGQDVYLSDYPIQLWQSDNKPANLYNFSELADIKNTTYICHTAPTDTLIFRKAENYILQSFNPHNQNVIDEINSLIKTSNNRVLITTSFTNNLSFFEKTYTPNNVCMIEGPAAPNIPPRDKNFQPSYLLWAYRNFYHYATSQPDQLIQLFNLCKKYLKQNPILKIAIVVGAYHLNQDINDWFWQLKATQCLKDIANRIEIYCNISWDKMMQLNYNTKVIISPAEAAGGPAFEAAINSIPVILTTPRPFDFPGIITAPPGLNPQFFHHLEKLLDNLSLYEYSGKMYYDYVKLRASFEAWTNRINQEIKKRNW